MFDVTPTSIADAQAEADRETWLEYFKIALDGAASSMGIGSPEKVVERAELIASAAVAALKVRAATKT